MTEQEKSTKRRNNFADWERIKGDFYARIKSVPEIAKEHNVAPNAIWNHAKRHGWERPLKSEITDRRDELLARAERETVPLTRKRSTEEIIEDAARLQVEVVRSHRKQIEKAQILAETLLDQLEEHIKNRPEIEAAIRDETKEDESPQRRNRMLAAVSLGAHIGMHFDLAKASQVWIGLERQAFNLEAAPKEQEKNSIGDLIAAVNGTSLIPKKSP